MEFVLFLIIGIVIAVIVVNRSKSKTPPTGQDYSGLYTAQNIEPGTPRMGQEYRGLYGTPPTPVPPADPQPMPDQQVPPQQVIELPPPPPVPKKPFSPIPLLLVVGVIFLFLGGIVFLTSTWEMLSGPVRAIALLGISGIAFGANILAERKLELPKVGLAFYILGCIYLPLALGGIGVFELLGSWFSFQGEGRALLLAVIFGSVAGTSFLGQKNYNSAFLAWLTLMGMGGMYFSFAFFFATLEAIDSTVRYGLFAGLLWLFSLLTTLYANRYLARHADYPTHYSTAWVPYLYAQNFLFTLFLLIGYEHSPLITAIFGAAMAGVFLTPHFKSRNMGMHTGIFGFCTAMLIGLISLCNVPAIADTTAGLGAFTFVTASMTIILLTVAAIPRFVEDGTAPTFTIASLIFPFPAILFSVCTAMNLTDFLFLYTPLVLALGHFIFRKKNPISQSSMLLCLNTLLLHGMAMLYLVEGESIALLLLIGAALLLLVQALFNRRIWALVLSICSCAVLVLAQLPDPQIWYAWLCAAVLIAGAVYAHLAKRPLLEVSASWVGIVFVLNAVQHTCHLFLEDGISTVLTFAVLGLFFLAELVLFTSHERAASTKSFCMNLSLWFGGIACIQYFWDGFGMGWLVLLALLLVIFTAANLKRPVNVTALPLLIMLFTVLRDFIVSLDQLLEGGGLLAAQVGGYVVMLLLFAALGRILLPKFACGGGQIDWALLAGVLPVFGAAVTLDWHPTILVCLFLSIYSLLYVGRVKEHYIPALLASMFGCLAIFFHNVNDPFGILELWKESEIKSLQVILYLLPMHLFLLSLIVILPKKFRSTVHLARFCMYCFTMLCLLIASFSFGRVEDALILAVFSFLIFGGSLLVKRLRWFTLGFSMLVLITIRMTWHFWKSLHWGIYLFLIGILLIGIAFYYEYGIRRADKKPEEIKEKLKIFKEWSW